MRRRLTGLARMAIPARPRPGRGRSRAAARQCRGSGSLAMAVKAQVTAAPVPYPRPGSPGVGSRSAGDRALPPAGGRGATAAGTGRSPGAGPGIASRPDPVAGIGWDTVRAPAEAPWSPSTGRPRRTRPDQAGKDGSFSGAIPGALTARDAHSCRIAAVASARIYAQPCINFHDPASALTSQQQSLRALFMYTHRARSPTL